MARGGLGSELGGKSRRSKGTHIHPGRYYLKCRRTVAHCKYAGHICLVENAADFDEARVDDSGVVNFEAQLLDEGAGNFRHGAVDDVVDSSGGAVVEAYLHVRSVRTFDQLLYPPRIDGVQRPGPLLERVLDLAGQLFVAVGEYGHPLSDGLGLKREMARLEKRGVALDCQHSCHLAARHFETAVHLTVEAVGDYQSVCAFQWVSAGATYMPFIQQSS